MFVVYIGNFKLTLICSTYRISNENILKRNSTDVIVRCIAESSNQFVFVLLGAFPPLIQILLKSD